MKRLLAAAVVLAVLTITAATAAETVRTAVKETQGRSGPGSYYGLRCLIPQGAVLEVLERRTSWYRVVCDEQEVWVSVNSLAVEPAAADSTAAPVGTEPPADATPSDPFGSLPMDGVSVKASPAALAAAIKGFWTRYAGSDAATLHELPVEGYDIDIPSYETFAAERRSASSRGDRWARYPLEPRAPGGADYEREHAIGYAIASSLADVPLVTDARTVQYVHAAGWYVAESTEGYDTPFVYYILDTDRINAVAAPGGYIVLTRGLLDLLGDEAELAALLAHEMAHVIAGHAMQTMEEREVTIRADAAFDMLAAETGTEDAEADLIGVTTRAVAVATSPKLDEQEYEADRLALAYLARSGYDTGGLVRLLETMMSVHERSIDLFDLNYRNHPDFGERLRRIEREGTAYRATPGDAYRDDFVRLMRR